jgi:hypothetical protein
VDFDVLGFLPSFGYAVDTFFRKNTHDLGCVTNYVGSIQLCLRKTLSGMTHGWAYGNQAADGRISDPTAARYPIAVREASAA